eukprot:CAMPEP_0202965822 /NCGR_PEP_ID=MMETSP1396-20130829/9919_1 /ASSEMBLY_ACC=CAM_ASM_000872 /TAXON_ID= /ORGANISM="Pseudokeronopsis sp., Strain Brazil" /LENGTH=212 /DNA_ID=CAMNT_0049688933 /DNA_START=100 /DNA_END=738 /DNA_ORIENTATION=-
MAHEGIVIASFSHNAEIDIGGVKQVLQQPNLNMSAGKHYTFSVGSSGWHLIADDLNLIYILICTNTYPQRVAHQLLEELQRTFVNKIGDKATTAKERSLDKTCAQMFRTICVKYDNLSEVDKLAAVSKKVDAVKLVMQENIDIALQNCVKLESIEKAAEELQQQAGVFKRNANELKKKMWWKNIKMKLIIGFIILAILGIIIGVAVAMSKSK